jgi:1-acyl-sn-glycerol-3-phosphate acyltransferase
VTLGALRAPVRLCRIAGLAARTLAGSSSLSLAAGRALAIHGLRVEVQGPLPRGPALLVANHLSYLDPLLVASQLPCVPVSKVELASWPLLGPVARRLGVIFVDRRSPGSRGAVLRQAEEVLRRGGQVLNFPEGTTSDGTSVLPFRKGLFGVAQALDVPVVAVALRYRPRWLAWIGDATFVPHALRVAATERSSARLTFGEPLPPRACATPEALAAAARARTIRLLEESAECLRKTP